MNRMPTFNEQEWLAFELMHALIDSWTFSQLHESTETGMVKLFGADHVALCLMSPEMPTGFHWKARTTGHFLQDYYQWYQDDFVFRQLSRQPNTALSDTEMLEGQKAEDTETFRRSREADLRLRHVLAVLIAPESQEGQGAVALYKDTPKPFSEDQTRFLQMLTHPIKSAFQNVMRYTSLSARHQLLEALSNQASACLVLTEHGKEILRTEPVTPLLERWFPCSALNASGIPHEWVERLTELVRVDGRSDPGRHTWRAQGLDADLKVTFHRMPRMERGQFWEIRVEEFILLPHEWRRRLTRRQVEVALCLLRERCTDEELARLLKGNRKTFSAQTVKKHLQAIYKRVGADDRIDFMTRALSP
ncbi:hypothetical protein [Melittangium boletus]|uniref:Helix-turn-helix transcriptional regulator n=1 Tax=Melittangium boletus DSM 14713 TaxID=1294270 RepID=A0A250I9W5_9BACT|nr:hypothetical protein [Melittangium boletus]ATB28659.1 helix-turn-helix transcriptional regulator [Melittangium boletus DSM 14713]